MHHWQTPQGYVIESKTFGGLVLRYYCQVLREKLVRSIPVVRKSWRDRLKKPLEPISGQSMPMTIETSQIQNN